MLVLVVLRCVEVVLLLVLEWRIVVQEHLLVYLGLIGGWRRQTENIILV